MDRRGGCCIARYAGGAYDMSKVDRIMLKFRPIAPKPAANVSLSGGGSSSSAALENSCPSVKTGRGKRKGCNNGGSSSNLKKRSCRCSVSSKKILQVSPENTDSDESVSGGEKVVAKTLPLLPEVPGVKENSRITLKQPRYPLLLSFENGGAAADQDRSLNPTVGMARRVVARSLVKVERVTDTWVVDCYGYGGTDEERVMSLDRDTCPGFVSDGLNGVMRWTNAAYRQMVARDGGEVVVEEGVVLPVGCAAFTCRVRVVTCSKGSQTVPCDVWRMECGGFACRLDTTAALSLSLGS